MSQILIKRFPVIFKKLAQNLLSVRPDKMTRRKKKTRMAIAKYFTLHTNIKRQMLISEVSFLERKRSLPFEISIYLFSKYED